MSAPFSDIELSTPRFERDGLRMLGFQSAALGRRGNVTLFVPRQAEGHSSLPIAILLHGVLGTHWSWALNGGAHLTAQALIDEGTIRPMVLALPSDGQEAQGTGYLTYPHADCERWIVEDVPAAVRHVLDCTDEQSPLFIGGLSMGGYGALRLGGKHPHLFRGISAHSSCTEHEHLRLFVERIPDGPVCDDPAELSAAHWLIAHRDRLPPVRFDCGVEDKLIEHNRALHAVLDEAGVVHTYEEYPGAHSWAYWEEHLRDTLCFFEGCLGS